MPNLRMALLDVLHATRGDNLRLIIGGGYGIYLKREYIRGSNIRTLLSKWPEARSTNDLDLFLRPELLIDSRKLRPLAATLQQLGYQVIAGAEKYQFARPGPSGGREGSLKIDLLTGPQIRFRGSSAQVDARRVRPRPSVDLHAHPVDEAITLEEELLPVQVIGTTSHGQPFEAEVYLPGPFTFAMMKLFAFRDRVHDPDKQYGQYHALDVYSALATASEGEWNQALVLRNRFAADPKVKEASGIVAEHFSTPQSLGILRIQENEYFRKELQLSEFRSVLTDLFPPT